MARPTSLNDDLSKAICESIAKGHYLDATADRVGLHRDTIYGWLEKGREDPDSVYGKFSDAFKRASYAAEDRALTEVLEGANGWQSRAWFLERRYPKRWGRVSQEPQAALMWTPDVRKFMQENQDHDS